MLKKIIIFICLIGGFGFSANTGGAVSDKGEYNSKPQGSTTITMKNTGSEAEQTTHATIGAGSITVGGKTLDDGTGTGVSDVLAGLNRDTDNAQEVTKDMITGALDASVTIDNRVFTESGREQIINQHENLAENIKQIGDGLRNNVVVKSVENAITDKTKDIFDTVGDYIEQDRKVAEMQKTQKELVAALNGATNLSPEEFRAAMRRLRERQSMRAGTLTWKLAGILISLP